MLENQDIARNRYRGDAGRAYHEEKRQLPEGSLAWVARARAELFQSYVNPQSSVFEYGCGYGWNLAALRAARKVGYDPSEAVQSSLAEAGIESVASPSALASGSFDVVICHHCLEHVPDPLTVLVELRRILKPGGTLLLTVPYESESRYRSYIASEPNHHLYSWNVQTLGNLVTVAGFEIIQGGLRRYGYDRFAARVATRLGLGEPGFRMVRRLGWIVKPLREAHFILTYK
ncbi:MAG TPA: class I SAM-dependent methyltransferase [Candidatus Limnocylindria bacterium]|jgi:SAM-dependent methyltransferase|nr:class I SAM-dependent methyltransferase [Candidatus Limnocylindria bacterium]